jgi:septum formation protein
MIPPMYTVQVPLPVVAPRVPRARRTRINGIVPHVVSTQLPPVPFILASRSPRRANLLREAGYDFTVIPTDIDEDDHPRALSPVDLALYLAHAKAKSIADRNRDSAVLGADTVIAFGDRVLGKPEDETDARQMLALLAGTTHIVITAVAVMHHAKRFAQERRVLSAVRMRLMSAADIDRYIDTGLWEGKAGGYGIQDGNPFIKSVAGCPTNVIGLPMSTTRQLLTAAGVQPARSNA